MKYCENYAALLDPFVDGELSEAEAARVRAHLSQCEGCRAYVEAALMIRDGFPDAEEAEVPDGFADGVMAAIRANAAPRKKKTAPWTKVLLPLAACCAIVVLVQGLSQNTGLWSTDVSSQVVMDTENSQPESEESADTSTDSVIPRVTQEETASDPAPAADDTAQGDSSSVTESYAYQAVHSPKTASDQIETSDPPAAESGPTSSEFGVVSNGNESKVPESNEVSGNAAVPDSNDTDLSREEESPEVQVGSAATTTTVLEEHLAVIFLTAEEAGDLLDSYTPASQTEDSSCYELSSEQYHVLLEQLAQREIVPENQLPEDQQVPAGTALVYVTTA